MDHIRQGSGESELVQAGRSAALLELERWPVQSRLTNGLLNNHRGLRRLAGTLGLLATAAAGAGWGLGWLYTHPIRVSPRDSAHLERLKIPYKPVTLRTADGLALAAWYTPPRNDALILAGHGWGNARLVKIHALLAQNGYGVLSWDFRAHGKSQGKVCTVGYREAMDVEAALDYALARAGVSRVGLWGGSMGGIAGLRTAGRRPEIEAMVLDSVPADMWAALLKRARVAVIAHIARFVAERAAETKVEDLRPVYWLRRCQPRPCLIIQSTDDERIPAGSYRHFLEAGGEQASLWLETGIKHMQMVEEKPAEYERRVVAFFDRGLEIS